MTCFRMDNGESVRKYCKRKGLGYCSVVYRIELGQTVEQAIKEAIEIRQRPNKKSKPKRFIGDIPLIDWCRSKGINYSTFYNRARKLCITPVEYAKKLIDNECLKL